MNFLEEVIEYKRYEIQELYKLVEKLEKRNNFKKSEINFYKSIYNEKYLSIIAEVKNKSPSLGVININENPIEIAKIYYESNVNAISVLTDRKFFNGDFNFLNEISNIVPIPLLCKDFIIDKIQIDLAKYYGASAVLLITEILNDKELSELYQYSYQNELDVLVEAHYKENIQRALQLKPKIIGINNRNLNTLEVDYKYSIRMREYIPDNIVKLSLSGIENKTQAIEVANYGYDGILIGTSVMKSSDKKKFLGEFLNISKKYK